jgi:hypothetical protein
VGGGREIDGFPETHLCHKYAVPTFFRGGFELQHWRLVAIIIERCGVVSISIEHFSVLSVTIEHFCGSNNY